MALIASPHGSQGCCHRASPRSQQSSVHEGADMAEGRSCEYLGKRLEQEEWVRGKRHASTSGRETLSAHRHQQTVLPFLYLQRVNSCQQRELKQVSVSKWERGRK